MASAFLNSRFDHGIKKKLAIRRQKPQLNHGSKASWELSVFYKIYDQIT